jgi:aspartate/methionine/tyrosine aminotransferase
MQDKKNMIHLDQPEYKKIEFIAQAGNNYISFSQGALRTGGVPENVREYARSILTSDHADYYSHSLGIRPLREKLAATLTARHNTLITIDNVMVSHGSVNGISAASLMLLNVGDEVLLPEPTYPTYVNIVKLAKATPVFVNACVESYETDGKVRWALDISKIKQATTPRTRMIMLSNPSNPCGVCLSQQELIELKEWCELKGIYLLLDEVYDNYIYDDTAFHSGTPFVPESELVIRTGSFSKDFAMSGWRIGFVVAPPAIINNMMGAQDGLICCPSVIGQYAALYALDHKELMKPQIAQMRVNHSATSTLLQPLVDAGIFSYIPPTAGFFMFLKTQEANSMELVNSILKEVKVALVPGKDFGPSGYPYIRLCYARPPEIIQEGFKRLYSYFGIANQMPSMRSFNEAHQNPGL